MYMGSYRKNNTFEMGRCGLYCDSTTHHKFESGLQISTLQKAVNTNISHDSL